jgi:hypothetical protein
MVLGALLKAAAGVIDKLPKVKPLDEVGAGVPVPLGTMSPFMAGAPLLNPKTPPDGASARVTAIQSNLKLATLLSSGQKEEKCPS